MPNYLKNAAVRIIVSGMVQGVGFRYYIACIADELGLKGYARNLFNGNVEIYAEGRRELLQNLAEKAKLGPSHSHVDSAKVEWLEYENKYDNFDIK